MHILLASLAALAAGPWLHNLAVQAGADRPFSVTATPCQRCLEAAPLVGRCRSCGSRSLRPWAVAALTAAASGWVAAAVGARWVTVAYVYLVGLLAVLFVTDIDHKRIPNRITYPGTPIGLALLAGGAFLDGTTAGLGRALGGGIVYASFFLVVYLVARGGLGFGDVKLALPIGAFSAFLGWAQLFMAGLVTAAVGGVMAVATLLWGRGGLRAEIPYGPAMIVGAVIAIAAGETLAAFLWA